MRFSLLAIQVLLLDLGSAFTHPSLLHTKADLDRVIAKVKANSEPWKTGWTILTSNSHASATYKPSPQATIYRGKCDGCPAENYSKLYNDAAAAYALALRWKISGDTSFANAARAILDGWASTLKEIGGNSDKFLASGIYGYQLANAAEILRSYSGWPASSLNKFSTMMRDVFYPMNNRFMVKHNDAAVDHYWANWELANIATMQAIGILSDNQTMYNEAVGYFKNGQGNGALPKAIWKVHTEAGFGKKLGQNQEAGRDQGHATLDFSLLGVIAQQSYNQGDDLFALLDNRILAGSEYVTKYNLGHDVPYSTYTNSDVTQPGISSSGRGAIRPAWELIHAHYSSVKGLNASWTGQMRDLVNKQSGGAEGGGGNYGGSSGGFDQLGYGTLMYRLKA
ncbi:putative GPI anchored protein [Bimuria novae-zelandiae CBS 107.79]|uniref:Putative GPI anchored protein n=1 Tax=Bimuria novae-zelandiae CBS 107.79 TaxID=1447943 RepID=A0A6A5V4R4_9PLEO|nr:putative GPI anchored protein [Bimuria novae-zelandiae CBS 107.79]